MTEGNGVLQKRITDGKCPRCKSAWQDIGTSESKTVYRCLRCNLTMEDRHDEKKKG